jgi:hypothetical protein
MNAQWIDERNRLTTKLTNDLLLQYNLNDYSCLQFYVHLIERNLLRDITPSSKYAVSSISS